MWTMCILLCELWEKTVKSLCGHICVCLKTTYLWGGAIFQSKQHNLSHVTYILLMLFGSTNTCKSSIVWGIVNRLDPNKSFNANLGELICSDSMQKLRCDAILRNWLLKNASRLLGTRKYLCAMTPRRDTPSHGPRTTPPPCRLWSATRRPDPEIRRRNPGSRSSRGVPFPGTETPPSSWPPGPGPWQQLPESRCTKGSNPDPKGWVSLRRTKGPLGLWIRETEACPSPAENMRLHFKI